MKKLHIHLFAEDLNQSRVFYSKLFGEDPSVEKLDYMKWELTEPALNFAVSARGNAPGIDHLGLQVTDDALIDTLSADLSDNLARTQKETTCCYAKSNKAWLADPQGVNWEIFNTLEASEQFSDDTPCCTPQKSACC